MSASASCCWRLLTWVLVLCSGVYVQWRRYQATKKSTAASEKPKPVGANLVQMKAVSLHEELGGIVRKRYGCGILRRMLFLKLK